VLANERSEITGYLLIALSRGGKTQIEKQMARAQQMESIGNFASGLAHDFGNFVSMILGKASMLRVKLPNDPHITADLDDIEAAGKRAQHLAQELMKFARGGRSRVEPLEMNKLIHDIEALIRASLGKKIELIFDLAEDLGTVYGDEVELQQMLMNLCLNARDAMADKGKLEVQTRVATGEEIARLAVGAEVTQAVCLMVRDNGHGMTPEVCERIFEPFFTTKEDSKGSGLGLAMVYGIVRRHGGIIDVRSEVGVGTTFEILLPVGARAGMSAEKKTGLQVLVVDDEPAFREMVKLVLEEEGHQVFAAGSGVEALKTLRSRIVEFSLVVLDLRMPGIDGLAVLDEIRAMTVNLPVLVTTGYADPLEKQEAIRKGAGFVLEKPYRVNDLKSALASLLGRKVDGQGVLG
jgi:nitrogen-specific signal transduction histidine kinase/ActR/RegA family two-component response regulator